MDRPSRILALTQGHVLGDLDAAKGQIHDNMAFVEGQKRQALRGLGDHV